MKLPAFFWLWFVALPFSAFAQKGVILHKSAPWDADKFVRATLYKEVQKFETVHNVTPMAGNKLRVNNALVVKDIPFPTVESLKNITEEAQVLPLEAAVTDWTATIARFPASSKHLKPRIDQLKAEITQFRSGKAKSDGVWMPRDAYLAKVKKAEEDRRKLVAKLEDEAKQLGMLASEWASLDEEGRKILRAAKLREEQAKAQAEEQRRIQEEIERQKKREAERVKMKPVERLATDLWITPPGFDEQKSKEYKETLNLVQEQLNKAKLNLGFGRESQRMVLKVGERVYVFKAADISPDVHIVTQEEKEKPSTIVLESTGKKEVIVAYPMDGGDPAIASMITLPTTAEIDTEKLSKGLSKIIELCGGKREEVPKEQEAPKDKETKEKRP